ncbi:Cysteine desulfurase [compost metagenome]
MSEFEHKAVLESAFGAVAFGFSVEVIPVNVGGLVDLGALERAVADDVAVISVMAVNNEIGTIQPLRAVAKIAAKAGAFFHSDATQAPMAIDVDVFKWGVDAASFSSHKLYGPKGVGALYLSSAAPWRPRPLMFGGGQEKGLRPGTLPTALCAGFGLAMSLIDHKERAKVAALRDRLFLQLKAGLPDIEPTCAASPRHPGSLHVRFPRTDAKDLITRLQPRLSASTGSACTSGHMTVSHVLKAVGFSEAEANEGVRLSLGRFTRKHEVDEAAALITEAVLRVRASLRV